MFLRLLHKSAFLCDPGTALVLFGRRIRWVGIDNTPCYHGATLKWGSLLHSYAIRTFDGIASSAPKDDRLESRVR